MKVIPWGGIPLLLDDLSLPLPSVAHCLDCGLRERPLPSPRVPFVREAGGTFTIHNGHETLEVEGREVVPPRSHSRPVAEWGPRAIWRRHMVCPSWAGGRVLLHVHAFCVSREMGPGPFFQVWASICRENQPGWGQIKTRQSQIPLST